MIDFNKIPKQTFDELAGLIGFENAEKYVLKVKYNYAAIVNKITYTKIRISFNSVFKFTIAKFKEQPLTSIAFAVLLVGFLLYKIL